MLAVLNKKVKPFSLLPPPTRSLSEVGSGGDTAEPSVESTAVGPVIDAGGASSSSAEPALPIADPGLQIEEKLATRKKQFEFTGVPTVGSYYNCFDGFAWTSKNLDETTDPLGTRALLRTALSCAIVVLDYSDLAASDFPSCTDELLASWFGIVMNREGTGWSRLFLNGKSLYHITEIDPSETDKYRLISEGDFACRYVGKPGINLIKQVRRDVRLTVTGDSGLLNFPAKSGVGKQVNVNTDIAFGAGMQWKNIEMRAVGAGTVVTFTQELAEARSRHVYSLIENDGTRIPPKPNFVTRDGDFRYVTGDAQDPFYGRIFDENHVALVFMNLNDLYATEGGKFAGADAAVMRVFKENVYRMIVELRYYRLCAVICGPSAAFWGCKGNEETIVDGAIA